MICISDFCFLCRQRAKNVRDKSVDEYPSFHSKKMAAYRISIKAIIGVIR